ncbi:hypothetical protein SOVF_005140 isoform B [Spinacia oleracea]|nr:hypothetical protein SOVF_005140 isoform B [Spinacia oleracea]
MTDAANDGGFSPFNITNTGSAPPERLKRWRQAALVLNASRRFRYTLNLKKEENEKHIRAHVQAAANLFNGATEAVMFTIEYPDLPHGGYGVTPEVLADMSKNHDLSELQKFGGVTGLAEKLKSNVEQGIPGNDEDILQRKNVFGTNTYAQKKGRTFWRFLWEACLDLTLLILVVAALASLALGIRSESLHCGSFSCAFEIRNPLTKGIKQGWYDGGSVIFAVFLVIVVTAISDYQQYLQLRDLRNLNGQERNIHYEITRGGRRVMSSIFDIIVGDVIHLKVGDQVPADGVLISGYSLAIDESSITGVAKIITMGSKTPFLTSGCKVADGFGTMLVISVGVNTEWGRIMSSIPEDICEETPLQVRLNGLTTFIGLAGLTVPFIFFVAVLIWYFTGHTTNVNGTPQFERGKTSAIHALGGVIKIVTVAVAIIVVAVPEGFPLFVTLMLASLMKKLITDKAMVRRLSAIETMGSVTTICTGKTGTLTLNQMTVVEAYANGKKFDPPNDGSLLSPMFSSVLIEGIAQNTTGCVCLPKGGGDVEFSGSPTEKAILSWGVKLGLNFVAKRAESTIIHASPFNSEKKRGGVAVKTPSSEVRVHWKGAAEIVLASCTSFLDENDSVMSLDEDKLAFYRKAIKGMAEKSLRCVAIAYRSIKLDKVSSDEEQLRQWAMPDDELVLLAIVGIKDPCRPGVRGSVDLCEAAGVKICMVTGDNLQTAKAIAVECGILASDADCNEPNLIEGKSFRSKSEAERENIAEKISVMGRSSPNDKFLLVQALKRKGQVVAVTGHGTNDAPALNEGDIGLAMGIAGTEVAKESSDIIILDDNFHSVVKVIRWGRSVYANIQKFIQFQLTVNVAALIINVVVAISTGDVPLNAVQLLWVNLIIDVLGALALAKEPPTDHLMHRPPIGRREPLITNVMWWNLFIQAVYQLIVVLVLDFFGQNILPLRHDSIELANEVKYTMIFNTFVLCQIFNEFNARRPDQLNIFDGIIKNYFFIGIIALTLILQFMIVEFLGKLVKTVKLTPQLWLVCIVIGFISWPLAALGKLGPVPKTPVAWGVIMVLVGIVIAILIGQKYTDK